MTKAIIGIGLPGSGKTTVLKRFAEKYNYRYVSTDAIREELTGDAANQSKNTEVFQVFYARIKQALNNQQSIVIDATHSSAQERARMVLWAREEKADKIHGIFVDTPLETSKERNSRRERIVPEHAIDRMHNNLQESPPALEDGFDALFTLDEYHRLTEAEIEKENKPYRKEFKIG